MTYSIVHHPIKFKGVLCHQNFNTHLLRHFVSNIKKW